MSTDMLATGLSWLHAQRREHMTQEVVFHRAGEAEGTTVRATVLQNRYTRLDPAGIPVVASITDFIVAAAEIGSPAPVAGDAVVFGGRRYEIVPLGDDPCWRWTDASRVAYRIHTQDTGAE